MKTRTDIKDGRMVYRKDSGDIISMAIGIIVMMLACIWLGYHIIESFISL